MYKHSLSSKISISKILSKIITVNLGRPQLNLAWFTALITIIGSICIQSYAVQAPDGTVAFESAVLLVKSSTTFNGIRVRQAIYYFDLELPNDVGESLQKVVFKQRTGGDKIKFRLDKTQSYLGDRHQKQEELDIATFHDETTGEITVIFDQPIPPGNRITIGLKPKRNPDWAGVYLFGVTAFPTGKKSRGMYLGPGRLQFYDSFDNFDSFYR
ncbi:DUF2808 domain-containing protein [Pleurocapsa sp. PCC 7319]|uniref:DUF2808 domain-containing protein n=1 Tax=Pleurocapsa sp. PCC 7319 TaxID=118161 RepID=UPI00034678A3|nr:DUF2808 domain-containing protein [Pleurocapsa sp. PCC 7319]